MSPIYGASSLGVRDDIKSVPKTFSSWDKCMDKDYCKWPVIVAIIVGSLIVLSIVACIVNCLCCGFRCCTGCCECCSMCCPSGRRRDGRNQPKYLDGPPAAPTSAPPPYYQSPPPLNTAYQSPYVPPPFRGPQVAQYDAPTPAPSAARSNAFSPVHEDSLPAMPTWNDAVTRRVEDTSEPHHDDMEMAPLNPGPGQFQNQPPPPITGSSRLGRSGYVEVPSNVADVPSTYHHPSDHGYMDYPYGPSSPQPSSLYSPAPPSTAPPTYVSVPEEYPYRPSPPPGRPPTILMSGQGRRPVPNSTRIV